MRRAFRQVERCLLRRFNSRTPGGVRPYCPSFKAFYNGFNSRTPGGVRLDSRSTIVLSYKFQFTHPGRGATYQKWVAQLGEKVSIHAPREGCDGIQGSRLRRYYEFQFTHPGRGATSSGAESRPPTGVSIHAPREGCDRGGLDRIYHEYVSIHAPREGCDPIGYHPLLHRRGFNSRTPGGVRPDPAL